MTAFAEDRNLALRSTSKKPIHIDICQTTWTRIFIASLFIIVTVKITLMSINHEAEELCQAKNETQYGTENVLCRPQVLSYLRDMKLDETLKITIVHQSKFKCEHWELEIRRR